MSMHASSVLADCSHAPRVPSSSHSYAPCVPTSPCTTSHGLSLISASDLEEEDQEELSQDELLDAFVDMPPNLEKLLNGCGKVERRSRRKVEVDTVDCYGRPLPPADIRKLKRRITNRDSARRIRLMRQVELESARDEVQQLLDGNRGLVVKLREVEDVQRQAREESLAWQQLWQQAMAANIHLNDRLAAYEQAAAPTLLLPGPLDMETPSMPPGNMDLSLWEPLSPQMRPPVTAQNLGAPSPGSFPGTQVSDITSEGLVVRKEELQANGGPHNVGALSHHIPPLAPFPPLHTLSQPPQHELSVADSPSHMAQHNLGMSHSLTQHAQQELSVHSVRQHTELSMHSMGHGAVTQQAPPDFSSLLQMPGDVPPLPITESDFELMRGLPTQLQFEMCLSGHAPPSQEAAERVQQDREEVQKKGGGGYS